MMCVLIREKFDITLNASYYIEATDLEIVHRSLKHIVVVSFSRYNVHYTHTHTQTDTCLLVCNCNCLFACKCCQMSM